MAETGNREQSQKIGNNKAGENGRPKVNSRSNGVRRKGSKPQGGLRIGFGKVDKNGVRINKEFSLNLRKFLVWTLIILLFAPAVFGALGNWAFKQAAIPLSQAVEDIKAGRVEKIRVAEQELILYYKVTEGSPAESQGIQAGREGQEGQEGRIKTSRKEAGEFLSEILERSGIDPASLQIEIAGKGLSGSNLIDIGLNGLFLVGTVFFFLWMMRMRGGGMDPMFGIGKSNAKLFTKGKQNVRFTDVGGLKEAKQEIEEIVDFLKHPKKYQKLGARTPKGVLLIGPSGTGKTLLARAIAGEADVPFYAMAGSEFMEMLVGVGASRTRDLFQTAKSHAPSIIFIDEIDAIGQARGPALTGGHGEREQTLNQILVEMDGFESNEQVVVCAASVVGDTPVLIRKNGVISLCPIAEIIDEYYGENHTDETINVDDLEVLGLMPKRGRGIPKKFLYFGGSRFVKPGGVFRHRVDHIYEVKFLGGIIRATGDHSVFVRTRRGIEPKEVRLLKPGDYLVQLPTKVNRTSPDQREIRAHRFNQHFHKTIDIYEPSEDQLIWRHQFLFAQQHAGIMSQSDIADQIGVTQTAVSDWLRGRVTGPRVISREYFKHSLPEKIRVTPEFCRLLGYYVAEGYSRKELDFCFAIDETEYIDDVINLTEKIFGLLPDRVRHVTAGAVNIIYYSKPLALLFARLCGKGAHHKHLPPFLFEAPFGYYQEFLRGCFRGDGYLDRHGRGELSSVSRQLILELNWLSAMHGIKTYVRSWLVPAGRIIGNGKPLPETTAWRLGWGKTMDPLNDDIDRTKSSMVRAVVRSVKKLPFDGYVYDFVGCDGEAFFGGESPVLLHNTNRPDTLDPALIRPGRFDRRVMLDLPDLDERQKILMIHAKNKPIANGFSWEKVAKRTVGFSGADLENMLNEAAIMAARKNSAAISMDDIEEAATKVKLGPEKRRLQSALERKMTAYHEAGHAVVAHCLVHTDPVHRISIVSRGMALGFTEMAPLADKVHQTKSELVEKMAVMLGGRAAEELIFNELTGGAASDIDRVTQVARKMVVYLGMSDLGPIDFGQQYNTSEYGLKYYEPSSVSDKTLQSIDKEIKRLVDEAYKSASEILRRRRKPLDRVAEALVEEETLDGEKFVKLFGWPKAGTKVQKSN